MFEVRCECLLVAGGNINTKVEQIVDGLSSFLQHDMFCTCMTTKCQMVGVNAI